jgi:hypothetical protein
VAKLEGCVDMLDGWVAKLFGMAKLQGWEGKLLGMCG